MYNIYCYNVDGVSDPFSIAGMVLEIPGYLTAITDITDASDNTLRCHVKENMTSKCLKTN